MIGPEPEDALCLDRVTKTYKGTPAVDHVSLRVPRGSIYGLLGPNGAGKTTTIRIALGFLRPDSGNAYTLGLDPREHPLEVRRSIGVVLEHDGHYEPMTVQENLEFHARMHDLGPTRRRRRIEELLNTSGLTDKTHTPVGDLSKGMKRILALSRALLHHPRLLILDEPTTGLDAQMVDRVRGILRETVQEHGVTVVLATHHLHEAEKMCDRVAILHHGTRILEGPTHQVALGSTTGRVTLRGGPFSSSLIRSLKKAPGVTAATWDRDEPECVQVQLDPGARAAPVVRAMVEKGVPVEAVERDHTSLEETFLQVTANRRAGAREEAP